MGGGLRQPVGVPVLPRPPSAGRQPAGGPREGERGSGGALGPAFVMEVHQRAPVPQCHDRTESHVNLGCTLPYPTGIYLILNFLLVTIRRSGYFPAFKLQACSASLNSRLFCCFGRLDKRMPATPLSPGEQPQRGAHLQAPHGHRPQPAPEATCTGLIFLGLGLPGQGTSRCLHPAKLSTASPGLGTQPDSSKPRGVRKRSVTQESVHLGAMFAERSAVHYV